MSSPGWGGSGLPWLHLIHRLTSTSFSPALGVPSSRVPAEEADWEGGLLYRGVQDSARPGVWDGVLGER